MHVILLRDCIVYGRSFLKTDVIIKRCNLKEVLFNLFQIIVDRHLMRIALHNHKTKKF